MKITDDDMFTGYKVGDTVKVLSGTFENSIGQITAVDQDKNEVTLRIMFFGRFTEITSSFDDIEEIK